jgi:hypothetical protein
VINNTAYYSGGLDANAPTYPLSGSYLEAVDINTLAPLTLQTVPDAQLNTSRYRHQLAPWGDDRIIMVGGQCDDRNGASVKAMTMVTLDLATRTWQLKRSFWQGNGGEPLGSVRVLSKVLFISIVQIRLCGCGVKRRACPHVLLALACRTWRPLVVKPPCPPSSHTQTHAHNSYAK